MFRKYYYNYNNYKGTTDSLFAMNDGQFKKILEDTKDKNKFQPIKYHSYSVGSTNLMLDTEDGAVVTEDGSGGYKAHDRQQKHQELVASIYNHAGKIINIYNHFLKHVTQQTEEYANIEAVKYIILQQQCRIAEQIRKIVEACDEALKIVKAQPTANRGSAEIIKELNDINSDLNSEHNQIENTLKHELYNLNNKLAEAYKLSNSKGLYFDSNSKEITEEQLCVDHIKIRNDQSAREQLFTEIKNNVVRDSIFDDLFQTGGPDEKLHVCNIEWFASIMLMQTEKLRQRNWYNEVDIDDLNDAATIIGLTSYIAKKGFIRCWNVCNKTKKDDDAHFVMNKYNKIFDRIIEIANDQIEFLKAEKEKIQKELQKENNSKSFFGRTFFGSKNYNIKKIDGIIERLQKNIQDIQLQFYNTAYDKDQKFIASGPAKFTNIDVSKFQCW